MKVATRKKGKKAHKTGGEVWNLRLYIAGKSARSLTALANLQKICDEHPACKYHLEVIDLLKNPRLAAGDQIIAVPTLVRLLPPPIKRLIGDLSKSQSVVVGLDLRSGQVSS
jgi:circadian clock protein KaiB